MKERYKDIDQKLIERCIQLAKEGMQKGELPFASLIAQESRIIVASENNVDKEKDVTAHAEITVMRKAQKLLSVDELTECTLYTTVEPCPMCSFMIRELKLKKVVFSMYSPIMGGFSKWHILQDKELQMLEGYFGNPPKVVGGILEQKTESLWKAFAISPKGMQKIT